MKLCINCNKPATQKHHVVRKSRGGTDNPENLAPMCFDCHIIKLHSQEDQEVIQKTYDYIKPNLSKCWDSENPKAIKPKIIRMLESDTISKQEQSKSRTT